MSDQKKALFVWGGWDIHDPENTSRRFADALTARGYDVTMTDDPAVLADAEQMATFDVININMTLGEITQEQEQGLEAAVKAGAGLAGWHGGMCDAFRMASEYQFMTGGQWVAHPGDTIDYTVQITAPDDPIMEGIGEFTVRSEQYYMHTDPGNNVLATTTFSGEHAPWVEGTVMPVVWTRKYGDGKVFYCSIGHTNETFEIPEVATIVERGFVWATR